VLEKRSAHYAHSALVKDRRIAERLAAHASFRQAQTILLYAAKPGEVGTAALFEKAMKEGKRVALPKVKGRLMEAREVKRWSELKRGAFGIPEPAARNRCVKPGEIDLVVVPGIAFDRNGHRIGFGMGYYDRFLKRVGKKAVRVGIAYAFQIVKELPFEEHDVRMHFLVTEKRAVNTRA